MVYRGAVIGVAAVAAVAFYEHGYALVQAHGEAGWTARLVQFTVDGLIYASAMYCRLMSYWIKAAPAAPLTRRQRRAQPLPEIRPATPVHTNKARGSRWRTRHAVTSTAQSRLPRFPLSSSRPTRQWRPCGWPWHAIGCADD